MTKSSSKEEEFKLAKGSQSDSDEEELLENNCDSGNEAGLSDGSCNSENKENGKIKKIRKPGIIYLSTIPASMNVSLLQTYFGKYGQLGRTYFDPIKDKGIKKSRGHMGKRVHYSEGWVEFKSKRKAISVAEQLNNQPLGGKKRNADNETLWNIKYLPRFKWAYLNQQLEYERQVRRQRMNIEIAQVRKDAEHYITASDIGDKLRKLSNKKKKNMEKDPKSFIFRQKTTEEDFLKKRQERKEKDKKFKENIQKKKLKKQKQKKLNKPKDDNFLGSIFVGSEKT